MANKITKDTMKRLIEEVMKESSGDLPKFDPIEFTRILKGNTKSNAIQ